jgi:acetyl-CoA C-acetyltransferase
LSAGGTLSLQGAASGTNSFARLSASGGQNITASGITLTGGLPYAGGPASNYAMHAVAALAERLRQRPSAKGLTTGNGWYLTKHSACVWSGMRPRAPAGAPIEAPTVAGPAPLALRVDGAGEARLDAYTVTYARDGRPERGSVVGSLLGGGRFVANTPDDAAWLTDFVARDQVGTCGVVRRAGEGLRFEPV